MGFGFSFRNSGIWGYMDSNSIRTKKKENKEKDKDNKNSSLIDFKNRLQYNLVLSSFIHSIN